MKFTLFYPTQSGDTYRYRYRVVVTERKFVTLMRFVRGIRGLFRKPHATRITLTIMTPSVDVAHDVVEMFQHPLVTTTTQLRCTIHGWAAHDDLGACDACWGDLFTEVL